MTPSPEAIAARRAQAAAARRRGILAETLVAKALSRQGWQILGRNVRGVGFELDLLASKGDTLIAVEVKALSAAPSCERSTSQLLPRRKREALLRGIAAVSSRLHRSYQTLRLDLALVYPDKLARLVITYYPDAVAAY